MDITKVSQFAASLKGLLGKTLPGTDAQFLMAPDPKEYYNRISNNPKQAAVLALLYPTVDGLKMVYIKRTSAPQDKHSGQISFPGGKLEADESLQECALRETAEEVGISKDQITLLGELTKVYVFVSNFMVTPYVGFCHEKPTFTKDQTEVEEILEISVNHLLNTENHKVKDLKIRGYLLKDVPYYDINGQVLWGATAMMTSELMHLIGKIDHPFLD